MADGQTGTTVRLNDLVKRFGEVLAVDNVSLDIFPGEFITFLGPSGSGKTTTLMMIAGFEIPDNGEILIDKEPVMFSPAYKRDIGMVFQNYSLFPHMTVRRNITFPLRMRGLPKEERTEMIRWALELVKLPGYDNRYPRQLSGGQQQRVALARALVYRPRLLLMDEPLGALDKKLREHMQYEIKQITSKLSITTIYVTHDQAEAMTMSDRIAVMNEGRIIQIGTPAEVYDTPVNLFVADFIGESNFIEGRVVEAGPKVCRFEGPGGLSFMADGGSKTAGQTGHLVVRPEKISFTTEGQTFPNRFEAVVEEMFFLGDTTQYQVKLTPQDLALTIKQQNRRREEQIKKGDKVFIGWDGKDNCIV